MVQYFTGILKKTNEYSVKFKTCFTVISSEEHSQCSKLTKMNYISMITLT